MKIFLNDPFDAASIERLKFIYLYAEEVEVLDYSPLFGEIFDGRQFMSRSSLDREVDREIRKMAGRPVDGNELARLKARFRPQMEQLKTQAIERFDRLTAHHVRYWRYLRDLADAGIVTLRTVDEFFDRTSPVHLHEDDARKLAQSTSEDVRGWLTEYLATNYAELLRNPEELQMAMAVNAMVLFAYVVGAIIKQAEGGVLYTGAPAQLRAIRALFHSPMPAATRLGELVVSIELPILRSRDVEQLVQAKEQLQPLRRAFMIEMNALTAGLEQHEWNDALIAEIQRIKVQKVDPILHEVNREVESLNRQTTASGAPWAMGAGAAGVTLSLLSPQGVSVDIQMIASLLAAFGLGGADWFRERYLKRLQLDKNRLAYVIRLDQVL